MVMVAVPPGDAGDYTLRDLALKMDMVQQHAKKIGRADARLTTIEEKLDHIIFMLQTDAVGIAMNMSAEDTLKFREAMQVSKDGSKAERSYLHLTASSGDEDASSEEDEGSSVQVSALGNSVSTTTSAPARQTSWVPGEANWPSAAGKGDSCAAKAVISKTVSREPARSRPAELPCALSPDRILSPDLPELPPDRIRSSGRTRSTSASGGTAAKRVTTSPSTATASSAQCRAAVRTASPVAAAPSAAVRSGSPPSGSKGGRDDSADRGPLSVDYTMRLSHEAWFPSWALRIGGDVRGDWQTVSPATPVRIGSILRVEDSLVSNDDTRTRLHPGMLCNVIQIDTAKDILVYCKEWASHEIDLPRWVAGHYLVHHFKIFVPAAELTSLR
eukprot:TRINITY_DN34002_c0_g1_i1.p1 TRINITY_DN34002_c0_g1~~TRINITY_DN34002_c0_g1_i1.p1  ORF type:complete len:387 (+),score=84.35 TRINITY_DN34002_c0_g1_i1:78-1238(+)